MSDDDEVPVRVTMKPSSSETSEADWANEFEDNGDATTLDPDALERLRQEKPAKAEKPATDSNTAPVPDRRSGALEAIEVPASDEFDEQSATVMEPSALEAAEFDDASKTVMEPSALEEASSEFDQAPKTVLQAQDVGEEAVQEFDEHAVTVMAPNALAQEAEAEEPVGKEPCPTCGVMVAPGYPKCPRCKASLTGNGAPGPQETKGGTSMIGRTIPWTIVVIAAILTAIIVYLAEREPSSVSDEEPSVDQADTSQEPPREEGSPAETAEPSLEEEDKGPTEE